MLEVLAAGLIQGSSLCHMDVVLSHNAVAVVAEECYVLDYVLGDGVLTIDEFNQVLGNQDAEVKHNENSTI